MKRKTALRKRCLEYEIKAKKDTQHDLDLFIARNEKRVYHLLRQLGQKYYHLKFQISVNVRLGKYTLVDQSYVTIRPWFNSSMLSIYSHGSRKILKKALRQIIGFYDAFLEEGSGWTLDEVLSARVIVVRSKPFRGGCEQQKLPTALQRKKACLAINCSQQKCFLYSVLGGIERISTNAHRATSYNLSLLNYEQLTFPVTLRQIPTFEACNDVSVNVFTYSEKVIIPIYVTTHRQKSNHVNLLLLNNHYYTIRNMSRLLYGQNYNHHRCRYICDYCLCSFNSKEKKSEHSKLCQREGQRYNMPPSKTFMKFKNFNKCVEAPFVIYCGFEALNVPVHEHSRNTLKKRSMFP